MSDAPVVRIGDDDSGRRLDRVLRKAFPAVPVGRIYRAVRSGEVRLNGHRVPGSHRVASGDELRIPPAFSGEQSLTAERPPSADIPIEQRDRIVFANHDIVVVNKLAGELTHGEQSLETLVRRWAPAPSGISFRIGPAHRLDRNTSGLIVFGITRSGAEEAAAFFAAGSVVKRYVALLGGRIETSAVWDEPLERDGSSMVTRVGTHPRASDAGVALTRVDPLAVIDTQTLAIVTIETGRTHQIRAHAAHHGHALCADVKYGGTGSGVPARMANGKPFRRYLLHAASLTLRRPSEILGFDHVWAPPPADSLRAIEARFGRRVLDSLIETVASHR